ncbi:MAG: alanine--glyoxylate aminotransferase family protein [Deltaproteobacteria bacterium]|nr:alanine--glyoxylate aminotransferase family protein [Deltaproteobacteria bacterium]
MKKYRLFTPGPTPVSEQASLAMAHPMIHHRTKVFEGIIQEVRDGLRWLFQTKQDVLLLASSGTGAMEGTITNLFSKGDRLIVVDGGKFGERWWKIGQAYGLETDIIKVEWGKAVVPQEIEKRLKSGNVRGVLVQASESSTGVYHPIREIAEIVRKYPNCLLAVDAISALGAINLPMDSWGIDVLLAGSQKGLGLPPGLAFVALSEKGWGFVEKSTLPRFYFDFKKEQKNLQKNQTAYTPAISLIVGLAEALRELKKEGLEELFGRHERMARATREGMKGLGLKLYAESPANSLTAVCSPDGMDAQKIVKHLQEKYNLTIAGGQDDAKGKIFRIAHLGYYDELDVVSVLAALEWTLTDLGYKFPMGSGVAAAMQALRNSPPKRSDSG